MIRLIERKNLRSKIETCWGVSDQIENCVRNSENFEKLQPQTKMIVQYSIGKSFLGDFIKKWGHPGLTINEDATQFYNEESKFWTKTSADTTYLNELKTECDLFALNECCKATYNLDSLEGNYENIGQSLSKEK
jgi:hypothetical protein